MPFMDDMLPEDDVVPAGAAELLLGLAVVPMLLVVLGEDAAGAAGAADCDVLGFGALWQPANAKRTAEAKINFFIICSPISIGVGGAYAPAQQYIQCRARLVKRLYARISPTLWPSLALDRGPSPYARRGLTSAIAIAQVW